MFVPVLVVTLMACGLAVDLGHIYNRKIELHGLAKSAALAAAGQLDGSADGVAQAIAQATATVARSKVGYKRKMAWSDSAIRFSKTPERGDGWVDASTARASPAGYFYVEIDTVMLSGNADGDKTFMLGFVSKTLSTFEMRDRAVAGRASLNVTPLAVCAMAPAANAVRVNPGPPETRELVEFGFRRGISYDLMALNPNGATGETFAVDPVALPGAAWSASSTTAANLAPFVCTGKIWAPRVTGGDIHVRRPFQLDTLHVNLNSRFDIYDNDKCNANGAPPDYNIKQFRYDALSWMGKSSAQSAEKLTETSKLRTFADPLPPPGGITAVKYGPLWTYSRPAKFSEYVEGDPEPDGGYGTFATTHWTSLYKPAPAYSNSLDTPPYSDGSANNYASPDGTRVALSLEGRRVLNIPLLTCPVSGGENVTASVAGIGKFFMTVPATADHLFAEFAGIVPENTLLGPAELYP